MVLRGYRLKMKIGTCQAEIGQIAHGELQVVEDAGGAPLTIPLAIARGSTSGKTMFLSAGVHGDEINGIAILQRFMQELDINALRGTIILLPLVNVSGFEGGKRHVQYDGKDLNRCFPGSREGSISEQLAQAIFHQVVARCDFGVDVHDSGQGSVLLPHPRAHIMDESGRYDSGRMELIAAFGTDIIMLTRGMDGVMTFEASRILGIPAFTVEIGGGGILWEGFIRRALTGLKNLLIFQDMLPGEMCMPHEQYILPGADNLQIQAGLGGILHSKVNLGEAVNKGQILAEIFDPVTLASEVIRAQDCGVVHDLNVRGKVNTGEDVIGFLEFSSCPHRGCKPTRDDVETILHETSKRIRIRRSEVFDAALSLKIGE
jgi:uncharacterized protein